MATTKQSEAARRNIKKAQAKWKSMSHRQHAVAQPQGAERAKPGTRGAGKYFRIIVRPEKDFVSFRTQDVGKPGGLERVAGHRSSGSWATHAWLISKDKAHVEKGMLIPDDDEAKALLETLATEPVLIGGDVFKAKDRRNIPEKEKPTEAQRQARARNIKKAQASKRKKQA